MDARSFFATPIRTYLNLRSAGFLVEFQTLSGVIRHLPLIGSAEPQKNPELLQMVLHDVQDLFQQDAENIVGGLYPLQVLKPEPLLRHVRRLPKLLADGVRIGIRRRYKKSKQFSSSAEDKLKELPAYYQRNFHFQTDGYLSESSAELYEHQVELLFLGAADSMRRLCIAPLKRLLNSKAGEGLRILEVGCGSGRGTRFLKQAFPKAKIVATDLSAPYLKIAQKNLRDLEGIDFLQADAAALPFQDGYFDAVVSIFMFHELPKKVRRDVLNESARVLRPGGWAVAVDSIQLGDKVEFDALLERFPVDFHEPFYKQYSKDSLTATFAECGLQVGDESRGFLSKCVAGQKVISNPSAVS